MNIRPYIKNDWEFICNIFDRAKPDEMRYSCDLKAIKPLKEDEHLKTFFKKSEIFVAEINGKVVGFSGYYGSLVSWLIVDPEYYRQGIGRKLLHKVLSYLGEKAYLNVAKFNEPAKNLYFSEGFQIVQEYCSSYNGYSAYALKLAKNPALGSWR